ncbi:MAG: hypothetical protein U0Z70_07045 [Thermomicrobiales bacterium]
MILLTVTRRCLRHDGFLGAEVVVVEINGDNVPATAAIHRNGCRGQDGSGEWPRTPGLVAAEEAIRALVEEVKTTLGGSS